MTALLVLQIIIVVLMVIVILMQNSSSDGFTGQSSGGFMTSRGQANLLTKTTTILATIFIVNSLILAYVATHTERSLSIVDTVIEAEEQDKKAPSEEQKAVKENMTQPTEETKEEIKPEPDEKKTPEVPISE